ncbi:MAG: glycosyltransferase [bacterium]
MSETFIGREIEALRRRGWILDVASLRGRSALAGQAPCGPLVAAALRHALPLLFRLPRLPIQLLRHLPQAAALAQQLRATRSAGIHAHFAHLPADIALLAARHAGVRFTCSVHAWDVFAQPPAAIRRRLLPAAAVCACSQAAADAVCAAGIDARRVHRIRHGLPLPEFVFAPDRAQRRVLAVGRLEPKKGFDLLIDACARLRGTAFSCQIIGEGSQRRPLEQRIAAHGVADCVTLRGAVTPDEVRRAMRAADMLVLPSRRLPDGDCDGVANVLIEAMALGTPVITTAAGAAGEVIQDGVNGRLVPPEDAELLAAAIGELLKDSAACGRLARAGRRTIEASFDEAQTITQLEAVLREPVPGRPLPSG